MPRTTLIQFRNGQTQPDGTVTDYEVAEPLFQDHPTDLTLTRLHIGRGSGNQVATFNPVGVFDAQTPVAPDGTQLIYQPTASVVINVSTTGDDTTGDGTAALPFATFNKALLEAGRYRCGPNNPVTIQFGPGVFTDSTNASRYIRNMDLQINGASNVFGKRSCVIRDWATYPDGWRGTDGNDFITSNNAGAYLAQFNPATMWANKSGCCDFSTTDETAWRALKNQDYADNAAWAQAQSTNGTVLVFAGASSTGVRVLVGDNAKVYFNNLCFIDFGRMTAFDQGRISLFNCSMFADKRTFYISCDTNSDMFHASNTSIHWGPTTAIQGSTFTVVGGSMWLGNSVVYGMNENVFYYGGIFNIRGGGLLRGYGLDILGFYIRSALFAPQESATILMGYATPFQTYQTWRVNGGKCNGVAHCMQSNFIGVQHSSGTGVSAIAGIWPYEANRNRLFRAESNSLISIEPAYTEILSEINAVNVESVTGSTIQIADDSNPNISSSLVFSPDYGSVGLGNSYIGLDGSVIYSGGDWS